MKFKTDLNPRGLQAILSNFLGINGWEAWEKRQQELRQQQEENPLLQHYFVARHSLELAMFGLYSYRRKHGRLPKKIRSLEEYQLCSLMSMVVGFHKLLASAGRNRLAGRIRDGLQSENGLVALQHEMNVAAHFLQGGYDVEPFDLEYGGGVDFIVRKGGSVAEIECKMASADLGRKIHQRHMVQLSHVLWLVLVDAAPHIRGGRIITITLAGRLTGQSEQHRKISAGLAAVLTEDDSVPYQDDFTVQTTTFDLATSPFWNITEQMVTDEVLQSFITQKIDRENAHAFIYGKPKKCSIIVIIDSVLPDKVGDSIYKQLKDATKLQFTRDIPGVLAVGMFDMSPTQLIELAKPIQNKPNALQLIASRLFENPERNFLHTIAFTSSGGAQRSTVHTKGRVTEIVTDDGPCYVFRNKNNPHSREQELNFFNSSLL